MKLKKVLIAIAAISMISCPVSAIAGDMNRTDYEGEAVEVSDDDAATPSDADHLFTAGNHTSETDTDDMPILDENEISYSTPSDAGRTDATHTSSNAAKVPFKDTIILPEPTKRGFVFVEWNTMPDGSGERFLAGEEIEVTAKTLYAVWEPEEEYENKEACDTNSNDDEASVTE